MAYTQDDFVADVIRAARIKHLDYERSRYLLARWYAEFSSEIPNDSTEIFEGITGQEVTNIMVRCSEVISDMEADGSAKLNTVLQVSDLPLGDS